MKIGRFLRAAVDVVLPRTCVVCGCRLNLEERHLCLGCLADMPLTRYWERRSNPMADKFNERIQRNIEKGKGGLSGIEHERYAYTAALFFFHSEAEYRKIPYRIKYQGDISAGRHFGRMLGRKLAGETKKDINRIEAREDRNGIKGKVNGHRGRGLWADVDMVIPVPLHWTRLWKRGYNQAEVIAGAVAKEMGVAMRTDILIRRRRTKTQVELGIDEKLKNVRGAFTVSEEAEREMKNIGHILLVDDVFTSGSTLVSCFHALRKVFPKSVRISAVTLGYLER